MSYVLWMDRQRQESPKHRIMQTKEQKRAIFKKKLSNFFIIWPRQNPLMRFLFLTLKNGLYWMDSVFLFSSPWFLRFVYIHIRNAYTQLMHMHEVFISYTPDRRTKALIHIHTAYISSTFNPFQEIREPYFSLRGPRRGTWVLWIRIEYEFASSLSLLCCDVSVPQFTLPLPGLVLMSAYSNSNLYTFALDTLYVYRIRAPFKPSRNLELPRIQITF